MLRLDALVRDADAALYSAKALGRNQVYVFRETGDEGTIRRAPITAEARTRAIDVGKAAMLAAQDALIDTLVGRAEWAGRPSTMIADASVALARAIDLPEGELERIRTASLLHDLGKLAIPEEILAKPGELAEPEWRVVTEHPKIGQVVLEQAGALRDAATIVLHHHEWFDGRGYPHGLAGTEIPVGARIVSIADAYEAMVSGRPVPRRDHAPAGHRGAPSPGRHPVRPGDRGAVRRGVRRRRRVGPGLLDPRRRRAPSSMTMATITGTTTCTPTRSAPARAGSRVAIPAGSRTTGRPPRSTTPSTSGGAAPSDAGVGRPPQLQAPTATSRKSVPNATSRPTSSATFAVTGSANFREVAIISLKT